jgi:uncharacterized protein DUF3180
VRPTSIRLLLLAALVTGLVTYAVLAALYVHLSTALPRSAPLSVLVAGLLEVILSNSVRARLSRRAGARPIAPLTVARLAALGRASSAVAAVVLGLWAGVLATTLPKGSDPPVAGADSITAGLGLVAALVLLAGALLLERACRIRRG